MNDIRTKDALLNYLIHTCKGLPDTPDANTTNNISAEIHISRSLASQYLNELNKEGKLVKVNARPVYYFSTTRLEEYYQTMIHEYEFYDVNELLDYLEKGRTLLHDFHNVIGAQGTLSYCTMQMKSAMLYPPHGLAVILQGSRGSGKAYLAQVMYEFCVNQGLIERKARFIKDYIHDASEHYDEVLFGSCRNQHIRKGLLEQAENGLLYLANATAMDLTLQRKLSDYIVEGKFTRVHDDKTLIELKTRIVLGVEKEMHMLHDELLRNIPVVCEIPPFSARVQGEREEMIASFLRSERKALQKPICISKALYQMLITYSFHDSIDELYTSLKQLCANAYAQCSNDERITMRLCHLPIKMLESFDVLRPAIQDEELLELDDLDAQNGKQQILGLYEEILQAHRSYIEHECDASQWLDKGLAAMRSYYDFIVFEQQDEDIGMRTIHTKMDELINAIEKNNEITLPLNCSFVLARIVYAMYRTQGQLQLWEHQQQQGIQSCLHTLQQQLPSIHILACMIIDRINRTMDVKLGAMNIIFLVLNLHFYNREVVNRDTCALIIAHGYSTATSIADATNQLLQTQVCKAIDMALDVDVNQIQKKLIRFIQIHPYYHNLILMVDMGSLEDIAIGLKSDMNIGVINNISTNLALDIGNRILQRQAMEDILREACLGYSCQYHIFTNRHKEKAIVFTSDVGIKVASKLVTLFTSSLPKRIHLAFIPYEYASLQTRGTEDVLFEKYEVVLLIKPHILKLEGVKSLALEDLISLRCVDVVNDILSHDLTEEEINSFNSELLKNFSLHSIMENLTILNPKRLLDQVCEAINQLQLRMNRKFQSKTIIGIYMHTCFLIERLVTKTAILSNDMDAFETAHADFIRDVHISFERMLKNYSVEIPISEISYLYDYIENEEREEK